MSDVDNEFNFGVALAAVFVGIWLLSNLGWALLICGLAVMVATFLRWVVDQV